jgi:hypothetical protein
LKFEEALAHLREGKKIRHIHWPENEYMHEIKGCILDEDEMQDYLPFNLINEDWELYEEPQEEKEEESLSGRITLLANTRYRLKKLEKSVADLQERLKVLSSPIISIE